jgi:hypothetical protein
MECLFYCGKKELLYYDVYNSSYQENTKNVFLLAELGHLTLNDRQETKHVSYQMNKYFIDHD